MHCLCAGTREGQRARDSLELELTGGCELSPMGAGNRAWVLCRSSKHA